MPPGFIVILRSEALNAAADLSLRLRLLPRAAAAGAAAAATSSSDERSITIGVDAPDPDAVDASVELLLVAAEEEVEEETAAAKLRAAAASLLAIMYDDEERLAWPVCAGWMVGIGRGGGGSGALAAARACGVAYIPVHSRAFASCCLRLRVYCVAIAGTSGSLGLGSVRSEDRESMTLNIERAGDQLFLRMSMHMLPCSEMFMWYIFVVNTALGAENG